MVTYAALTQAQSETEIDRLPRRPLFQVGSCATHSASVGHRDAQSGGVKA